MRHRNSQNNNKQMNNIRLIKVEWSMYNGLLIEFIGYNDRHLISINSGWKEFFYNRTVFYSVQNL